MIVNFPRETMVQNKKELLTKELSTKAYKWLLAKSSYYKNILIERFGHLPTVEELVDKWEEIPVTKELPKDCFSLLTGPLSTTLRFNKSEKHHYMALSQNDLAINLDMAIRALAAQNINNTSIVALCGDYHRGHMLDIHYGVEALGATVLPCGSMEELKEVIAQFHPDTIIGDATVREFLMAEDLEPEKFLLIANEIVEDLPSYCHLLYVNPITDQVGLIFACEEGQYHLQDDYCCWEIVEGELIFTPLTLEAMPLLKVATGVAADKMELGLCNCGRTLAQKK